MWNERRLWIQWRGNVLHLELIWGTPINFVFLRWHQCSSRLVTVLLGTLWSSIKQIEAPYVFDWERNCSGHNAGESGLISQGGESLMGFLELRQEPGVYCWVTAGDVHSKLEFVQWSQDTCLGMRATQEYKLGVAGQYGHFWNLSGRSGLFFYLTQWYWDS